MMRSKVEVAFESLLRDANSGLPKRFFRSCLIPFSFAFQTLVVTRHFLYDRGLLKTKRCSIPVVSVGNIVVGGTGKTPFTLAFVKEMLSHCKVAILSRGYRSRAEKTTFVLSRGKGPLAGPEKSGDEPFLLSTKLPGAIVIVGRDRVQSAKVAIEEGAELIVLDDGMQHRSLHRDLEIALVSGEDPLGGGFFLPGGFLRDTPKRLEKADFVIINGKGFTPSFPFARAENIAKGIFDAKGKKVDVKGSKVGVFCGIANPKRFVTTVESLGAEVVATHFLADHTTFSKQALLEFSKKAQGEGAKLLCCTEKDWVKLVPHLQTPFPLPLCFVECEMVLQDPYMWKALIEKTKQLVKR